MRARILAGIALALAATSASAVTRYVSLLGHHQSPYTSWYTAATNISSACTGIASGDTVLLSNGVHRVAAAITLNVNYTIAGVHGAEQCIISGGGGAYSPFAGWVARNVRYRGLTFTNFASSPINAAAGTFYVNDCTVVGNTSAQGVYVNAVSTLYASNCVIRSNAGPGVYLNVLNPNTAVLDDCRISGNTGMGVDAGNAGSVAVLRNCRIWGNGGRGVNCPLAGSSIANCVIASNRVVSGDGGGAIVGSGSTIRNCLVAYNYAASWAGGVKLDGSMQNCTVVSNRAGYGTGGLKGAGGVLNSIVFFNSAGTAPAYSNYYNASDSLLWTNCCTAPDPTIYSKGVNCKSADPKFVNRGAGNFRLDGASPCIDAGLYESWMSTAVDLDKRPRIQRGAVDMGAYELPPAGTAIVLY